MANSLETLAGFLIFAAVVCLSRASDHTLKEGMSGIYSRSFGMQGDSIELKSDQTYIFTASSCLISERGKGGWTVIDGHLILDGRGHPKELKGKLTKFLIVVVDHKLALQPVDDYSKWNDLEDDRRLFKSS